MRGAANVKRPDTSTITEPSTVSRVRADVPRRSRKEIFVDGGTKPCKSIGIELIPCKLGHLADIDR